MVYIEGIKMPKSHGKERSYLIVFPSGEVKEIAYADNRIIKEGGTAFEIPKHGDLIDRDALVLPSKLNNWESLTKYVRNITEVWEAIDNAPTVIEAEESE